MGFIKKTNTVTLGTQIEAKGTELRRTEELQASASESYLVAAQRAKESSLKAAAHALAVEQAISILVEAGVEL